MGGKGRRSTGVGEGMRRNPLSKQMFPWRPIRFRRYSPKVQTHRIGKEKTVRRTAAYGFITASQIRRATIHQAIVIFILAAENQILSFSLSLPSPPPFSLSSLISHLFCSFARAEEMYRALRAFLLAFLFPAAREGLEICHTSSPFPSSLVSFLRNTPRLTRRHKIQKVGKYVKDIAVEIELPASLSFAYNYNFVPIAL